MSEYKILIVDDDKNICELLRLYCQKEGFKTCIAYDGMHAIDMARIEKPDLMLLDIMMPELDGWQVLREIRKFSDMPIIMISARSETYDKVLGLELGADDYIVKPFENREVVARIKAVLRRADAAKPAEEDSGIVEYDKLTINMNNYELYVDGKAISTPPKELELLYYLASNPNRVFTREQLLENVWGFGNVDYEGGSDRTVDVHIKRIREKIEGVSDQWELKTVFRVGYKFEIKKSD